MVFSETTTRDGLIQECERITNLGATGISGNTTLLKDFTARINNAIDRFYSIVFKYDTLWNFDDRQYADSDQELPIATTSIVSGTRDYLFDSEFLSITQVFVADSTGTFHEVQAQDDKNDPEAYLLSDGSGTPTTYELVGNSVILNPEPNYDYSDGLKVTFKRNGVKFASTDGAITPGIPSLFHGFLARYASYQFAVEKSLKHANAIKQLILEDEAQIREFISNRAKPKRAGLKVKIEDNK
jgi:hypothetical protein